jgi:hypothetical protein
MLIRTACVLAPEPFLIDCTKRTVAKESIDCLEVLPYVNKNLLLTHDQNLVSITADLSFSQLWTCFGQQFQIIRWQAWLVIALVGTVSVLRVWTGS